ncbi:P27 family phage terminase small subunit [Mesorhizobium yinganensis]|uniref:P27 family phage terminase small subunit n=1 Tax=Mesorhizobium yinganensis TaxID=3157707 RepID=UPI0032B80784
MKKRGPNPPSHLSDAAKKWWRTVTEEYQLEPHHELLLKLAAEALDRAEQARAIIEQDGVTVLDDRKNVRAHPAVAIEKDARTGFARLLRELDLDFEGGRSDRRPPAIASNRRG